MGRWLQAAADLILGWSCAGCSLPGVRLCADCLALFANPSWQFRDGCPVPIVAAAEYVGAARSVVTGFKLGGMWCLARPLGWSLARAMPLLAPPPSVILVPVPSSAATVRKRGLDTTCAMTREMARMLPTTGPEASVQPVLAQRFQMRDQVGLGARQRHRNLRTGLRLRSAANWHSPVVVVDDIVTTGATAGAAVAALQQGGADVLAVVVAAHTPPPGAVLSKGA